MTTKSQFRRELFSWKGKILQEVHLFLFFPSLFFVLSLHICCRGKSWKRNEHYIANKILASNCKTPIRSRIGFIFLLQLNIDTIPRPPLIWLDMAELQQLPRQLLGISWPQLTLASMHIISDLMFSVMLFNSLQINAV
jgi:hypothetical protein